jgi:DNA primase
VLELHDEKGQLLAWVGRWVGEEAALPEGQGKYLFPAKFHKNQVLYNLHRVKRDIWRDGFVVVVEGYWSVMVLHELSVPAVALMGRTISARQLELLTTLRAQRVTVLLDGDEPGYAASAQVAAQLAKAGMIAKAIYLPEGAQPDTWLQLLADDPERLALWLSAIAWS